MRPPLPLSLTRCHPEDEKKTALLTCLGERWWRSLPPRSSWVGWRCWCRWNSPLPTILCAHFPLLPSAPVITQVESHNVQNTTTVPISKAFPLPPSAGFHTQTDVPISMQSSTIILKEIPSQNKTVPNRCAYLNAVLCNNSQIPNKKHTVCNSCIQNLVMKQRVHSRCAYLNTVLCNNNSPKSHNKIQHTTDMPAYM